MSARRLLPLFLLVLALAAPAAAGASTAHFESFSDGSDQLTPKQTLHKAQTALAGRGAADGGEVTILLKQLALKLPALDGAEQRRAVRLLARPTQGEGSSNELEYEVAEHKPELCSAHFCIHWVDTTEDAPPLADSNGNGTPDYVETMDAVFEHVYDVENGELGWLAPKSDGTRGCQGAGNPACTGKTDVYIKEIGGQGIYGYAAPDPRQGQNSQHAYLVMDDDYNAEQFPRYEGDPLQPMEVTAAHEYNHVLQFNYDTAQDTWMFESSATWMEDRVYTEVNDYLQYLTPWAQMTFVPLTQFNALNSNDPLNVKVYGDSVWNRWLETRYGSDTIRNAWAASLKTRPKSFAPGAYDESLRAKGTSFYAAFAQFAADSAEWRSSNSPFDEGETFPDVDRAADDRTGRPVVVMPDQQGASGQLYHTAYVLLDVRPKPGMPRLKLAVGTERGAKMAIALVARTGDEVSGTSETFLKRLPHGGPGAITVDNPDRFARLTAVVVNADAANSGFSRILQDWRWDNDARTINVRASADEDPPSVSGRSPAARKRNVSTRSRLKVSFSERMFELNTHTLRLIGPGGRGVRVRLALTNDGRKTTAAKGADRAVITPGARLVPGRRYTVRLSRDLRDYGGNALPKSSLTWSFTTKR